MMAGIAAKSDQNKVCLLEKNRSLGRKLLLTGNGRCNLTTAKDIVEIVDAFGQGGKFLYGALTRFSNQRLMLFFEERGVGLKTERGGQVFPESDRASTILSCLRKELKKKKVKIYLNFEVVEVKKVDHLFQVAGKQRVVLTKKLIIAAGGKSYPQTGSTGDGYRFAQSLGHKIVKPIPALVPLIVTNREINSLAGLSLKSIDLYFRANGRIFSKEFGEMLFTHQGISGPIVLKSSKKVYQEISRGNKVLAQIDLKPRLDKMALKKRIHREIQRAPKKKYRSLLKTLLPNLLIDYALKVLETDDHQQVSVLTRDKTSSLIDFLKNFNFQIKRVAPLDVAIVTSGGVDTREINPKSMESKIVPDLFFAGEIISLDGPTGGYNLQKAFSTGWVAGKFADRATSL